MVILYSLAVFTFGFWCTRAGIRQVGLLRTYHIQTLGPATGGDDLHVWGVVHNSPLCNEPQSRECKGPSAMVVPCRLTALSNGFLYSLSVFICDNWCTRAGIRQVGLRTYTCTLRQDFGYCNRCRRPCLWWWLVVVLCTTLSATCHRVERVRDPQQWLFYA